jgi:hypothetical protein
VRVEHYRVNETGHGWPESINGVPTYQVIWSFLSGFSMAEDLMGIEGEVGHEDGDGEILEPGDDE